MKQVKILWVAALIVFITACSDDKNSEEEVIVDDGAYVGTLVVDQKDGTFYTQEEVSVEVSIDKDTETDYAEILMKQVSFSKGMPVKLDMTIPKVSVAKISNGFSLSGTDIIPLAMGGEFPRYTITGLTGEVKTQSISFEMMCGEYPLRFSGVK